MEILVKSVLKSEAFDKAREGRHTGLSDTVVGSVVSKTEQDSSGLWDVVIEGNTKFVNEHTKHLNGDFLLFNFVSDNACLFLAIALRSDFVEDV